VLAKNVLLAFVVSKIRGNVLLLSYFSYFFVKKLHGLTPPTNQYYVSPQFQVLLRVESSPQVKRKALKGSLPGMTYFTEGKL